MENEFDMMDFNEFIMRLKQGEGFIIQVDKNTELVYYSLRMPYMNNVIYGLYKRVVKKKKTDNLTEGVILENKLYLNEINDLEKVITDYSEKVNDGSIEIIDKIKNTMHELLCEYWVDKILPEVEEKDKQKYRDYIAALSKDLICILDIIDVSVFLDKGVEGLSNRIFEFLSDYLNFNPETEIKVWAEK